MFSESSQPGDLNSLVILIVRESESYRQIEQVLKINLDLKIEDVASSK